MLQSVGGESLGESGEGHPSAVTPRRSPGGLGGHNPSLVKDGRSGGGPGPAAGRLRGGRPAGRGRDRGGALPEEGVGDEPRGVLVRECVPVMGGGEIVSVDLMRRAVWREGRVVKFCNMVGAFVGGTYVYEFPDVALARRFAALARRTDGTGMPVGIPKEEWGRYARGQE